MKQTTFCKPKSRNWSLAAILLMLAFVVSGCSSTVSSTNSYIGPSVSSMSAKKKDATRAVVKARSQLRKARKKFATIENRLARDERRLKRKKLSSSSRNKIQSNLHKQKTALRKAQREVKKAKRAFDKAVRAERRVVRSLEKAQRRAAAAQRRLEEAEKRKARRLARKKQTATGEAVVAGLMSGLFSRSDPASKYIRDYRARTDGSFKVAAIPVKKMDKRLLRQQVRYRTRQKVGTLVVDPRAKYLYLVQADGMAMRYGIGVGKAGFEWSGSAHVGWKQQWPKWTPPDEMVARRPELRKWSIKNGGMPGGPTNPLGARALYLMQGGVDTLYRLHGTPEWESIGTAASSGCIRLMNQDIIDLYQRVPAGTKVVVL